MFRLLTVAVLVAVMIGCAGMQNPLPSGWTSSPSAQTQVAKIAVQYATLKAIKNDPSRAAAVVGIADQALAALGSGDPITADQLALALRSVIPWGKLAPEDQMLASSLIALVVTEVQAQLPAAQGQLPIADIKNVVQWVRDAAAAPVGK